MDLRPYEIIFWGDAAIPLYRVHVVAYSDDEAMAIGQQHLEEAPAFRYIIPSVRRLEAVPTSTPI